MKLLYALRFLIAIMLSLGTSSGCSSAQLRPAEIKLPQGFSIAVYAANVPGARSMTLGARGTLFVGSRSAGKVYAIVDRNGDHMADQVITIASGLRSPNGVAFRDGALYVA